ncbi:hypothetical protein BaRGS_00023656, partial [Batillaria attramentaria]
CVQQDLRPALSEYPGAETYGGDEYRLVNMTPQSCQNWCTNEPLCRSAVYVIGYDYCYVKYFTAVDHPERWSTGKSYLILFQRTCA